MPVLYQIPPDICLLISSLLMLLPEQTILALSNSDLATPPFTDSQYDWF